MAIESSLLPEGGDIKKQVTQPFLFKYLDYNSAKAMLESSNIQFTRSTKLNDPFDCHPNLIDFSTEDPEIYEEFRKMRRTNYICSLSKVFDSILMWSYYNKHEGICIGLDINKVETSLHRQVTDNWFPPYDVSYNKNVKKFNYSTESKQALRYMTFTKASEWAHECEVRMACIAPQCGSLIENSWIDDDYWRPSIDGNCFVSIYLGVNIDRNEKYKINEEYEMNDKGEINKIGETSNKSKTSHKEEIIQLAQKLNPDIKIYQMTVNPDAFKLDYEMINF